LTLAFAAAQKLCAAASLVLGTPFAKIYSMNHVRVRGKAEIKALTDQVFSALQQAEMTEELTLLHERVFSLDPEALFNTVFVSNESLWTLKPMVELLLLHVHDIAISDRPVRDRRDEIRWAIDAAGF
jgi:hypothetical protein